MSKSLNLIYKLNGEVSGIDLFEITPILLSFGNLMQESQKIAFPERKNITIILKPFETGSFIVEMALATQSTMQNILKFASNNNGQDLRELLELIGLIAAPTGITLIGFIKWLKGKPAKRSEQSNSGIIVENCHGETKIIQQNIFALYNKLDTKNLHSALCRPFKTDCIESIESYIKEDQKSTSNIISKEDSKIIEEFTETRKELCEEERESTEEAILSPKRGSFGGEINQWSFRRITGDIITVNKISDEDFIEKCKNGSIRPFDKDMMKVLLKTTYDPKTLTPKKIEIVEVFEYIPFEDPQGSFL